MNKADLQIVMVPLDELAPYENNTRAHNDDDVAQIARSIQRYGFNDPVGIWSDQNIIVEGHGRLMAARSLGMTEIPCVRLDHLTDDQRREYGIMHNKTAELSDWDFDALERELQDLDLSEFGLTFDPDSAEAQDTEEELLASVQEDEVPEPPNDDPEKGPVQKPESVRGQIWQLGVHRLMCGDSTEEADVRLLMDGATADCVITDPPYNVAIENSQGMKLQNDDMNDEAFFHFMTSAFTQMTRSLKPGGAFYVWHADKIGAHVAAAMEEAGAPPKQRLIWVKNNFTLGRNNDYQNKHESCWYGWRQGAAHWFTPSRSQTTVLENPPEFAKMSKAELVEYLQQLFDEENPESLQTDVIHEARPFKNDLHPTMKPVRLIARTMRNSTRPGDLVLDLFGGSGTTMIAAEQLGRKAFLMELDERYCDVIIKRWEKWTGKQAQRIR